MEHSHEFCDRGSLAKATATVIMPDTLAGKSIQPPLKVISIFWLTKHLHIFHHWTFQIFWGNVWTVVASSLLPVSIFLECLVLGDNLFYTTCGVMQLPLHLYGSSCAPFDIKTLGYLEHLESFPHFKVFQSPCVCIVVIPSVISQPG